MDLQNARMVRRIHQFGPLHATLDVAPVVAHQIGKPLVDHGKGGVLLTEHGAGAGVVENAAVALLAGAQGGLHALFVFEFRLHLAVETGIFQRNGGQVGKPAENIDFFRLKLLVAAEATHSDRPQHPVARHDGDAQCSAQVFESRVFGTSGPVLIILHQNGPAALGGPAGQPFTYLQTETAKGFRIGTGGRLDDHFIGFVVVEIDKAVRTANQRHRILNNGIEDLIRFQVSDQPQGGFVKRRKVGFLQRERPLVGLAGGDVQGRKGDTGVKIFWVDGGGAQQDIDDPAVLALPARLHRTGSLAGDLIVLFLPDPFEFLLGRIEHAGTLVDQFITKIAGHVAKPLVGFDNHPVPHHADPGGGRPQNAVQRSQLLAQGDFLSSDFGDIPRNADHASLSANLHLPAGDLEGERAAVLHGEMGRQIPGFALLSQLSHELAPLLHIGPDADVENGSGDNLLPPVAGGFQKGFAHIQNHAVAQPGNDQIFRAGYKGRHTGPAILGPLRKAVLQFVNMGLEFLVGGSTGHRSSSSGYFQQ